MSVYMNACDPGCIVRATETLKSGGIVCLPTETVYGLVCSASNPEAIARLSRIKKRPIDKPFALFASSWDRMRKEAIAPCPLAEAISPCFWPGPLTLVIPAGDDCPCAYNGSVGVRCPDHDLVQLILRACGGLLCNTSLNRSGEPEYRALNRSSDLLAEIDLAIDGGTLPDLKPSTVIDCRREIPVLLREGLITLEMIQTAIEKER